jgi:hypothetical protein
MESETVDLKIELPKGTFADLTKKLLGVDVTTDNGLKLVIVNLNGDVYLHEYVYKTLKSQYQLELKTRVIDARKDKEAIEKIHKYLFENANMSLKLDDKMTVTVLDEIHIYNRYLKDDNKTFDESKDMILLPHARLIKIDYN